MTARPLAALFSALALSAPAAAAPSVAPPISDQRFQLDTTLHQRQSGQVPGLEVAGSLTDLQLSATTRCFSVEDRRGARSQICDIEALRLVATDLGRQRQSTRAALDAVEGRWQSMMVAIRLRKDGRIRDIRPIRSAADPGRAGRVDITDRQIAEWLFRPLDAAAPPSASSSRWAWRSAPFNPDASSRRQRMASQVELRIGDITEVRSALVSPGDAAQSALHVFNADSGWLHSGEVDWSGPTDPQHPEAGRTRLSARFHSTQAQGNDPGPSTCTSSGC